MDKAEFLAKWQITEEGARAFALILAAIRKQELERAEARAIKIFGKAVVDVIKQEAHR